MIPAANNLVSFVSIVDGSQHVWLTLDSDWTVTGGLAPNVNCATIPYTERTKLPPNLVYVFGTICFWGSVDPASGDLPEHRIFNQLLVDCTIAEWGQEPGDVVDKPIAYTLSFADHRVGFVLPRGGRLTQGMGNPDPLGDATLVQNADLIDSCLEAMGLVTAVPSTVNDVEPPRQLEWNGAHAPTELGKLLQLTGHVYCPASTGTATIRKLGVGDLPVIPAGRLIRAATASSVNRLPQAVVITSSPNAEVRTYNQSVSDGSAPLWEFVVQDPANGYAWKEISTVTALGSNPLDAMKKGFPAAAAKDRKQLNDQIYKVIRLKNDRYNRLQCPILRDVLNPDGTIDQPHLVATVADQDKDGAWINRQTRMNATSIDAINNLMSFDLRLGTVTGTEQGDRDPFFTPLTASTIKPAFSIEDYTSSDGKYISVFGYSFGLTGPSEMSEAAARDRLYGFRPEVSIFDEPELRVIHLNDVSDNRSTLASRAFGRAQAMLLDFPQVSTIEVTKFLPFEIDGRVNEIRYSQQEYKTTVTRDAWTTASRDGQTGGSRHTTTTSAGAGRSGSSNSASDDPVKQPGRSPAAARNQAMTQQIQRGGSLARQPVVQSNRTPIQATGLRRVFATPTAAISGQTNRYNGTTRSGRFNTAASGAFAASDVGPAGTANDCIIWSSSPLTLNQTICGDAGPIDAASGKLIVFASGSSTWVYFQIASEIEGTPGQYWANFVPGEGTGGSYPGEGNFRLTNVDDGRYFGAHELKFGDAGLAIVTGALTDGTGRLTLRTQMRRNWYGKVLDTTPDGTANTSTNGVFWVEMGRDSNGLVTSAYSGLQLAAATYSSGNKRYAVVANIAGVRPTAGTWVPLSRQDATQITNTGGTGTWAGWKIGFYTFWRPAS